MSYKKLFILCNNTEAEKISDALFALDSLSVTFTDAADEPIFQIHPDDAKLWTSTEVSALFPEDSDIEKIVKELKKSLEISDSNYRWETLQDEDWVRKTQGEFPPQFYGDTLCVQPTWAKNPDFSGAILTIDPGLAFGTGTHPTTALCLAWLAENNIKDKIVIDYGCGSGILALAALALGAKKVYVTDHDPQALQATKNNAAVNSFVNDNNLFITEPEDFPEIKADIVLANILANPLIELSGKLTALVKPEGCLILSGILTQEAKKVYAAYEKHFKQTEKVEKDNWCRLTLRDLLE
jgi:ribosomal protein L11 methyltransferase